jgi:hypothetical protein
MPQHYVTTKFVMNVHASGRYFTLPVLSKADLGFTTPDFRVGILLFVGGVCVEAAVVETVSGGEVRTSDFEWSFNPKDEVHAVAFIPAADMKLTNRRSR